jgi:hypothetical protein
VGRRARTAQDDRVAGLQAQGSGVDRDVRARLIDDRDDAERHPNLAHVQSVGKPGPVDHLADRVGQRRDLAHARGHVLDPAGAEREAIQQRVGKAAVLARLQIAGVGLEDLVGALHERHRDRLERSVLDAGADHRHRARRPLGCRAGLGD